MALNAKWHAAHVMPRGASDRARLAWHRAHQKNCGCRPIPASLAKLLAPGAGPEISRGRARAAKPAGKAAPSRARPSQPKRRGAIAARTPSKKRAAANARGSTPRLRQRDVTVDVHGKLVTRRPPGAPIRRRCGWAEGGDELYARYHDEEWGRPSRDDRHLFEMLILEGAQAGLSWITILRKRDNYRRAFDGFDPHKMARYDARRIAELMRDSGIVRNRLKIEAAVANARAFLEVQKEMGSFARFLWSFVGGKPIVVRRRTLADVPASTPESDAMSKALKKRGFKFVGSTICYAFMQATGLVNDHADGCFLAQRA
jgi:DNA-3-methyladenine glycosylase I